MNQYNVGNTHKNNDGYCYTIIHRIKGTSKPRVQAKFVIRFNDTGYQTEVFGVAIKNGNIKDRYSKTVFGVGCLGEAKKVGNKKVYDIWTRILSRCYNDKDKNFRNYGGNNICVSDRWLCFEYFLNDIILIDGYDEEKFYNGKLNLDKDSKQKDCNEKIYSLDTCKFISPLENNSKRNRRTTSYEGSIIGLHNGESHVIDDIPKFAKENGMSATYYIYQCLRGQRKNYKGWEFSYAQH